jgi:alpha-glucosidase
MYPYPMQQHKQQLWWQRGIIYQIYPRSFQDSNQDGVGDLEGIRQRLPYLASLGITAVWISPIFPSPMADFGYDVADYSNVDPLFGNLADFDRLLLEAHALNLKIVLDLVPNHSSDQNAWFLESRSSRENPKRDWYIWKDAKPDGSQPNNWLAWFGGSGWEWDETTGQYYFHQFLKEQPDLNWRNPEVREAIFSAMRFWLERGVDGFRVDVIWLLAKDELWRDEPPNPDYAEGQISFNQLLHIHTQHQSDTHEYIRQMRAVVDSYPERMMVGEIFAPLERLVTYYGKNDECHLPFNFSLILKTLDTYTPWDAGVIRGLVDHYDALCGEGWPNYVLGNHDQPRFGSRFGPKNARSATLMLLTLRGTPTFYYGDEIGMQNGIIPPDRIQDPFAKDVESAGRDPERTPMQWDASLFAGFSSVEPWLPLGQSNATANVAAQEADPHSDLNFFRAVTALRNSSADIQAGTYTSLELHPDVFAYRRGESHVVLINFSENPLGLDLSALASSAKCVLSTAWNIGTLEIAHVHLHPHEAQVLTLL